MSTQVAAKKPVRVFISYAWDDDPYRDLVKRLAVRLRTDGIEAIIDFWHVKGRPIPQFMNAEVRLANKVLIVCSPAYKMKVHAMEEGRLVAGSGWEATLITSALWTSTRPSDEVVPVLLRGTWEESAPDFIRSRRYFDLSKKEYFEKNYSDLLRELNGQNESAPSVGPRPSLALPQSEPLHGEPSDEPVVVKKPPKKHGLLLVLSIAAGVALLGVLTLALGHRRPIYSFRNGPVTVDLSETGCGQSDRLGFRISKSCGAVIGDAGRAQLQNFDTVFHARIAPGEQLRWILRSESDDVPRGYALTVTRTSDQFSAVAQAGDENGPTLEHDDYNWPWDPPLQPEDLFEIHSRIENGVITVWILLISQAPPDRDYKGAVCPRFVFRDDDLEFQSGWMALLPGKDHAPSASITEWVLSSKTPPSSPCSE